MKQILRFLCLIVMLCYSISGFSETTSMRVGDSYTIIEPATTSTNNHYEDYLWEYDASFFDVALSATSNVYSGNNIATITLKAPFQGNKTITCKAIYKVGYTSYTNTFTHTITCAPVDVALYPTVMTLGIGQYETLQWQFNPSNTQYGATVTFSSSDINIADVDFNGKVTARGAGTATITATTNYFTTATCEVTVNPMLASSISLNQTSITLPIGSTQTLTATILPDNTSDKTVTWSSNDESIATVDASGKVTAVSQGLATITATTNDGTNLSASCSVNVTQISATSIRLNQTEVEMNKGQSIKLTATVLPAGAAQRVTWSSSDPTVARVVGGTVYAQEMGECLITARTLDGTNLTADCLIMVYPEQGPSGGNGDVNGDGNISIADVTALIDFLLNGGNTNNNGGNEGVIDDIIW